MRCRGEEVRGQNRGCAGERTRQGGGRVGVVEAIRAVDNDYVSKGDVRDEGRIKCGIEGRTGKATSCFPTGADRRQDCCLCGVYI